MKNKLNKCGTFTISGLGLSDLFFNSSHDAFDSLIASKEDDVPQEELRAAIMKDAEDFIQYFSGDEVTAEQLTDDFFERL